MSDTQSRELHGESPVRYSPERAYRPLVSPPSVEDKDACAIYASVRKDATPSHEPIERAIPALQKMLHRAGNVDGEGDGCGLLLDIPRKIWAEEVRTGGHDPSLTLDDAFAVAHVFVERSQDLEKVQHDARELLGRGGFRILAERIGVVDSPALGPTAREEEPHFWQVAGLVADAARRDRVLFDLLIELERELDVHVPSLSATTCVYKVMGAPKVLGEYYPDLRDERFETIGCFGHNRYSTNTWPSFKRVQPFSVLGHNGEINTIEQLRQEARMLGVPIQPGLLGLAGPQPDDRHPGQPRRAQPRRGDGDGRAADRQRDPLAARRPAPLLHVPAPGDGPVRAGPGGADRPPRRRVRLLRRRARPAPALAGRDRRRLRLQLRARRRRGRRDGLRAEAARPRREGDGRDRPRGAGARPCTPTTRCCASSATAGWRATAPPRPPPTTARWSPAARSRATDVPGYSDAGPEEPVKVADRVLAGFGWQRDDVKLVQQMASNGAEPIGSLGYDGPLAALSPERQNLADYFKETVAVVTNPAIDREREMEHFSTRSVFGRRPSIDAAGEDTGTVETSFPVILGGHHGLAPLSDKTYRQIAREHQTYLLEDLWEEFRGRAGAVDISLLESETTSGAIERIKQEAVKKVRDGAELLVLTDRTVYDAERRYLDPHLATSAVDQALKQFRVEPGEENLRRRCGIVLRSAAIRNVHDTMLALGLGANGVCPYTMVEVICVEDYAHRHRQPLRGAAPRGSRK